MRLWAKWLGDFGSCLRMACRNADLGLVTNLALQGAAQPACKDAQFPVPMTRKPSSSGAKHLFSPANSDSAAVNPSAHGGRIPVLWAILPERRQLLHLPKQRYRVYRLLYHKSMHA